MLHDDPPTPPDPPAPPAIRPAMPNTVERAREFWHATNVRAFDAQELRHLFDVARRYIGWLLEEHVRLGDRLRRTEGENAKLRGELAGLESAYAAKLERQPGETRVLDAMAEALRPGYSPWPASEAEILEHAREVLDELRKQR